MKATSSTSLSSTLLSSTLLSSTLLSSTLLALLCAVTLPAQQRSLNAKPVGNTKLDGDHKILQALNRLTFGPRPGDVDSVKHMGLEKWIDLQLHPERIPIDEALELRTKPLVEPASLNVVAMLTKVGFQADAAAQQGGAIRVRSGVAGPGQTLGQAKLYRAVQSDRQLEEVLVDFWYNHFNVDAGKGLAWFMINSYEHDAIRPHVLGKFRDLLESTANSPAMMFYLDNSQSTSRGLNENYARELMELHALGSDGGYSQLDIVEVARCFTGWTVENASTGGTFRYDDMAHDKGEKIVLGVTIPAGGGKEDGEKVLDILARHPATARFISRELAQRFASDDPPPALVERMAKTFRESDGDIRAVLATLFASDEFYSEDAYRVKLKTPFETIVSAARATGASIDNAAALVQRISGLGQPLYAKLEPTGYSNVGADWSSSTGLMGRMNFAMDLVGNQVDGVKIDPARFSAVPSEAARDLLFTDASAGTLDAIGSQADAAAVAGMLLGSPDFQRR